MTEQDIRDLDKDAKGFLDKLEKDGDPLCGDDWSMVQILRRYLELSTKVEELKGESELYNRGYNLIGACDISNYLAMCEIAGKIGESSLVDYLMRLEYEEEYRKSVKDK